MNKHARAAAAAAAGAAEEDPAPAAAILEDTPRGRDKRGRFCRGGAQQDAEQLALESLEPPPPELAVVNADLAIAQAMHPHSDKYQLASKVQALGATAATEENTATGAIAHAMLDPEPDRRKKALKDCAVSMAAGVLEIDRRHVTRTRKQVAAAQVLAERALYV